MPPGSGLGGQIGFAEEVTYGTYVAPTRFLEFNSEGIEADRASIVSQGIGLGRFARTGRHKEYIRAAGGAIEFDYQTKGFGLLLKHALGAYANVLVVGSERKATITPDANGLQGLFLTCQVGRPSIDGTVQPFSYTGGKVTSWELKAALDDRLVLGLNMDFKSVVTSQALGASSYPAGSEIFVFSEGAVTINAVTAAVKAFSVAGDNGLATDRRFLGNVKKEPLPAGPAPVTGQLDFEFEDLGRYAAWLAGTEVANLVLTFTGPTNIAGGGPPKLIVTCPWIVYDGKNPNIGGPEVIQNPAPFRALYDGVTPIITLEQRTTDTAA